MNNFKARREKLIDLIEDKSIVILFSNSIRKQSEDSTYPFYINRNFFYLTNISQDNSTLVLFKNRESKSILFIDEFDEKKEKWFGRKLTDKEAKNYSGVDEICFNSSFSSQINAMIKYNDIENIYIDFSSDEKFFEVLRKEYKDFKFVDVYPLIRDMRMVKDNEEISNIKEAIKITSLGLNKIIKELKTANNEYELYNAFNHEILNHGSFEIGFPSIIASGVHTCCLHYPTPYDKLDKKGLLLCDVGSAYNHYSSDITRTYPISGKFNDFQKKIYQIVLNCNKKVIEYIQVGRTLEDLQNFAKSYLAGECLKEGIINKAEDITKYYFHSVSHHLGLDTHDACDRKRPLEVGNIITVEPGLYIKEKSTGIRIEDDVLITKEGREVLSKDIAKEINDIEKLF